YAAPATQSQSAACDVPPPVRTLPAPVAYRRCRGDRRVAARSLYTEKIMSGIRRRLGILLPLLALVLPAGVSAQADEQAIVAELQSIQQELMPIQERALEDTALRTQREQATQALRSAMVAIDPAIDTKLDRLEAMFDEMRA